ncbi:MAG: hypothetical protein WCA35_10205 [Kovacikia sp.]
MSISPPNRQNWKELDTFLGQLLMPLYEFTFLYPGLTRKQLARVAGCSVDVVDLWYHADPEKRRDPTDYHQLRFALAHWLWTQDKAQPGVFEQLRGILQDEEEKN